MGVYLSLVRDCAFDVEIDITDKVFSDLPEKDLFVAKVNNLLFRVRTSQKEDDYQPGETQYIGRSKESAIISYYYAQVGKGISELSGLDVPALYHDIVGKMSFLASDLNTYLKILDDEPWKKGPMSIQAIAAKLHMRNSLKFTSIMSIMGVYSGLRHISVVKDFRVSQMCRSRGEVITYLTPGLVVSEEDDAPVFNILTKPLVIDESVPLNAINDEEGSKYVLPAGYYYEMMLGENPTLVIQGDTHIRGVDGKPAVSCSGTLTIKGNGLLTLQSGSHSACIGELVSFPQSYGRWTPASWQKLKAIVVDGNITIECKSETPYFSLGGFGSEWMPRIILKNGAVLKAPDFVSGKKRILESVGECYSGSTKLTGLPVYRMEYVSENSGLTSEF